MKRKYELKKRAESQAETRERIVRAAVDLHTTIGPAATSISAIAKEAGVQRHTVYAHFPDEVTLFRACSAHWVSAHPFPHVAGLPLAAALEAVYRWYDDNAEAVALLIRDAALYPEIWAERDQRLAAAADALAAPYGRAARPAAGHAVAFETWQSLVGREGLSNRKAAEAMAAFVAGAGRPPVGSSTVRRRQ